MDFKITTYMLTGTWRSVARKNHIYTKRWCQSKGSKFFFFGLLLHYELLDFYNNKNRSNVKIGKNMFVRESTKILIQLTWTDADRAHYPCKDFVTLFKRPIFWFVLWIDLSKMGDHNLLIVFFYFGVLNTKLKRRYSSKRMTRKRQTSNLSKYLGSLWSKHILLIHWFVYIISELFKWKHTLCIQQK